MYTLGLGDLSDERLYLYQKALGKRPWASQLDWNRKVEIPDHLIEMAWFLTSQSSYAEQTGMHSAAALMMEAPGGVTQLCCATAVQDEATHVETFARHAIRLKGQVAPPEKLFINLYDAVLDPQHSFLTRFTIHTLLEGWATDEFSILSKVFRPDLLSDIYINVNSDESRHVRIGIACIRHYLKDPEFAENFSLERAEEMAIQASGLSDETWPWLAEVSGKTIEEVRQWFSRRHTERMRQINSDYRERSLL
jgi:hypothetical protein